MPAATVFTSLAALTLLIALAGGNVPLVGDSYRSAAVAAFLLGVGGYLSRSDAPAPPPVAG